MRAYAQAVERRILALFEGEDVAAGEISCAERFGGCAWFRRIAEEDSDRGFIRFLDEAGVPLVCARVVVLPVGSEGRQATPDNMRVGFGTGCKRC